MDKLLNLVETIKEDYNISSINAYNSQVNKKIQGADLAVGLIRRILNEEENIFKITYEKCKILKVELSEYM